MSRETNRTRKSETRNSAHREKLYDERHRLTPTTSVWAAVPLPVLRLLQHEDVDRAVRVLFYLIEHSWATMIPPASYRGNGQDRDEWRPSTFAVKAPQKPDAKARTPFWSLNYVRAKDIADDLGLDEANVSKELKWLGDRGAIRTGPKGRPIFPIQVLDVPSGLAGKKLSDSTTPDFQHPYFQQLFDFRYRIEAAYEEAKREALAPVDEAYRPAFERVKTQEKELRKAAKKAKRQGVDLSEVVKVDNLEQITDVVSASEQPKPAVLTGAATSLQVVKVDNSKPLSPIRRVVKVDNFSGDIKSLGKDKDLRTTTTPAGVDETGVSVVVAQVLEVLNDYGTTTAPAAKRLLMKCKEARPDCTGPEIIGVIHQIGEGFSQRTRNPIGVLMVQVPEALKTPTRKAAAPARNGHGPVNDLNDEAARRNAVATLNDPRASDTDRQMAREILEQLQQPA